METPDIKTSGYVSKPMLMFTQTGGMDSQQEVIDPQEFAQRFEARHFEHQETIESSSSPSGTSSSSTESIMDKRRLIQVFIVDPDEDLPIKDALLYQGKQKLTDLTDQELFFEIDIKSIMDDHNKKRAKTEDKDMMKATGKKSYLEPVRIRDLKMTVVEVAVF